MNSSKLVFLCGARDFHAMDWYFSAKKILPETTVSILTDLIAGENYEKIISDEDNVENLIIIDKFLFRHQSRMGNIWRNLIKLLLMPIQIFLLKRHSSKNPNALYYAHSMYYLWLACFAKVNFIGTPQGSDVLIKPFRSFFYKYLSVKALRSARFVTVDSKKMHDKCLEISKIKPFIVQNGIDLMEINKKSKSEIYIDKTKLSIISIRGITPLYRIKEILHSRNLSSKKTPIKFIYPFHDLEYKSQCKFGQFDEDLGKVTRVEMYKLLKTSNLVISIPSSDSSPRSVYEAIFCNCIVAITNNDYFEMLPECMKKRILIVDIEDVDWFKKAILYADSMNSLNYIPSEEALNMFDQEKCFTNILSLINKNIPSFKLA